MTARAAPPPILGVILAGGAGRRLGVADKALATAAGRTLLEHVAARFAPQVDALVLNANGDPARFAAFALPVISDDGPPGAGPLAGVLAGLEWARANRPDVALVATAPCDTPLLPTDLVARLFAARDDAGAEIACARTRDGLHPVCALWPVSLADALREALVNEGARKVDAWTARYRTATADYDAGPVDPFFNVNSPEDLARAEALLKKR